MFTGPNVILGLKIAVSAVTVIFLASLIAIATGNKRWHGRLNTAFAILTLAAVFGLEVILRLINPNLTDGFTPEARKALTVHLCFSIPSAFLIVLMFITGWTHHRRWHLRIASVFWVCWLGTVITGLVFLPHNF